MGTVVDCFNGYTADFEYKGRGQPEPRFWRPQDDHCCCFTSLHQHRCDNRNTTQVKAAELLCNGSVIVTQVEIPRGFIARTRGLLGRDSLGGDRGMYFDSCNAIHTFGMRFPLDLFFFDRHMTVTRIVRDVGPSRMVCGGLRATSVMEVESGWLADDAVRSGDVVELRVLRGD